MKTYRGLAVEVDRDLSPDTMIYADAQDQCVAISKHGRIFYYQPMDRAFRVRMAEETFLRLRRQPTLQ